MSDDTGLGRFAEPALLVLTSLSSGPKHGYAIMADVEEMAGGSMGPGTLYAVLARLEERGLIQAMDADDRRRPYRLTPAGAAALAAQLEGMERLVRLGQRRLQTAGEAGHD